MRTALPVCLLPVFSVITWMRQQGQGPRRLPTAGPTVTSLTRERPSALCSLPPAPLPLPIPGKSQRASLTWTDLLWGPGPTVTVAQVKVGETGPPLHSGLTARRGWRGEAEISPRLRGVGALLQPLLPPLIHPRPRPSHTADGLPDAALGCLRDSCAPTSAPLLKILNVTSVLFLRPELHCKLGSRAGGKGASN